jgi:uncharacterized OB-fold protein
MRMNEKAPFTIEQFYRNISQGKLLAGRCRNCGKLHLPPRPLCDNCYSRDFDWTEVSPKGKLVTYTVIQIAPSQFQSLAPYAVGIIELADGPKIPGMICGVTTEQIRIGMELAMDFGTGAAVQPWPQWPRYYFKPV